MHVFVAADGEHQAADVAYVRQLWRSCGDAFGMTDAVPGAGIEWDGTFAARTRPGKGIYQAVLRAEHEVLCLSVLMEPEPGAGIGWAELERRWTNVAGSPSPGTLGVVKVFTGPVAGSVPEPPGEWCAAVNAPPEFEVWEAADPDDARTERRLVVLGTEDTELSGWTWISAGRQLPPLAKYLLHAAKLRYQFRVWLAAHDHFRQVRRDADATINRLLATVSPSRGNDPGAAELAAASRELVSLQARELGLIEVSTRLREMSRTVEIASANLAAYGGLFTEDRELAEWFRAQLDDDATYLEAALRRSEQIGTLLDQLVQRTQQRRQDSINLGLTGAIGAILMALAAIQSLQYSVPLPNAVKPAVISMLGLLALWVSLLVVRIVVPQRRWSSILVHLAFGLLTAAITWVVVAIVAGPTALTWLYCVIAGVVGSLAAVVLRRLRH